MLAPRNHSRRALRLRDSALALAPETRDRLRERAINHGVEGLAKHLGVPDRALLGAIAGIPSGSTSRVLAALTARGLP